MESIVESRVQRLMVLVDAGTSTAKVRQGKELKIEDAVFDSARHLAVFANGRWGQKTQEFRESCLNDYMASMIPAEYQPGYRHPLFEQVLVTFGGHGHAIERFMWLRLAESILGRRTDVR